MVRWIAAGLLGIAVFGLGLYFRPDHASSKIRQAELKMEEIRCLNLLTTMYLTKEQKIKLISLSEQAEQARSKTLATIMKNLPELNSSLTALKRELQKGPELNCILYRRYKKVVSTLDNAKFEEIEQIGKLSKQAEQVLTDNQKFMVREYKPCVIPLKNLSSPQRVGQVDGCEQDYKWMQKTYFTGDKTYPKVKREVLNKISQELKTCNIPHQRVEARLAKFNKYMDQAHKLSPEEFSIKKWDLVGKIGNQYIFSDERKLFVDYRANLGVIEEENKPMTNSWDKLTTNIQSFMLSPAGLRALKDI